MGEPVSIQCPNCWETFEFAIDRSEGDSEFIIDCEVCCRPMTVTTRIRAREIEVRTAAC